MNRSERGWRFLPALLRDRSAVAAIEMAIALPIMVTLLLGTVEVSRLLFLHQKLQNSAFLASDLIGRDRVLEEGDITDTFAALVRMTEPFDFSGKGRAIITSVSGEALPVPIDGERVRNVINWQRSGAGTLDAMSTFGASGAITLPASISLADAESMIIVEVVFRFEPIYGFGLDETTIRKTAFAAPRLAPLTSID